MNALIKFTPVARVVFLVTVFSEAADFRTIIVLPDDLVKITISCWAFYLS